MRASWFLFLLIMLAPIGALFVGTANSGDVSTVPALMQEAIYNTFFLSLGVGGLSLFLGVFTAWSISYYPLIGRSLLQKAMYLPLVFPSYVLAFIFLGTINDYVLLQGELWALIWIMSFSLFPYVYIFTHSALSTINQSDWESNEVLGKSFFYFLKKVVVPKMTPLLLSALVLVLFETLADFGAASILNVPVVTTLIYKLWYDLFSFSAAVRLSIHYLSVVLFLLALEQLFKREGGQAYSVDFFRQTKSIPWAVNIFISFICWSLVGVTLLFPVTQTLLWFVEGFTEVQFMDTLFAFGRTLLLAFTCGVCVVFVSILINYFIRFTRQRLVVWESVATIGYSLPGSILAVAIFSLGLLFFVKISPALSVGLLIFGLAYKFLPVGFRAIGGNLKQISPKMDEFSETTGVSFFTTFRKLHAPLLLKSILVSMVLVTIEVMKEMPMTLMLAPSGFSTLSIQIFNFTSEGEWEKAALPGLFLIIAGSVSIMLLFLDQRNKLHENS